MVMAPRMGKLIVMAPRIIRSIPKPIAMVCAYCFAVLAQWAVFARIVSWKDGDERAVPDDCIPRY
jgi:hypothetical protein